MGFRNGGNENLSWYGGVVSLPWFPVAHPDRGFKDSFVPAKPAGAQWISGLT
jgi:hypothetical protein